MLLSLLTPLCGVVFGVILLADDIGPKFAVGAALVLLGVVVVNLQLFFQRERG